MANRIPRKAKVLDVNFKIDGYDHMVVTKDDQGWHGVDDNGKRYYVFASHLRNSDICDIKVLEEVV